MTAGNTRTFEEAAQAASALRRGHAAMAAAADAAAAQLRARDPVFVATSARGSSDNAATYAKYLIETRLRIPTLSQAPSLASIFEALSPNLRNSVLLTISQSGRSEDLLRTASAAKAVGALVIALVNDDTSPLAGLADIRIPLGAGPELAIAATKSFIASLAAILLLVAKWQGSAELCAASAGLPAVLDRAWLKDWSAAVAPLSHVQSLFVLGRGLTFGVAQEMALKLKETCGIHAEAFSTAEVSHGPAALIGPDFPVLIVPPPDFAAAGIDEQIEKFRKRGALTIVTGAILTGEGQSGDIVLPMEAGLPPEVFAIAAIQSFYRLADLVAVARGRDPDRPPHLHKITNTR